MSKLKNKTCPYCGGTVVRKLAKEIIRPLSPKMENKTIYVCSNYPDCDAYVIDNHKKFVGTLANRELRIMRQNCHCCLDFIWKSGIIKDRLDISARTLTYIWLAKQMEIPVSLCHISLFDKKQCRKAFRLCGNLINKNMDKIESYDYLVEDSNAKRIITRFLKRRN